MRCASTLAALALLLGATQARAQSGSGAAPAKGAATRTTNKTPASPPALVFAKADTAMLRRTLDSLADAHRGVVGYSVMNMDTGERLSRRGDETFSTASLIKVPILVTVYDLASKGDLSLSDPILLVDLDKVGGAGVLQYMHSPMHMTIADAAWLMSTLSDNTATNLLLDRVKIRRVWQKMESLGLPHSKVHSGSMTRIATVSPDSSAKYGLGVTTPNEMAALFGMLANGKAVNPAADSAMLYVLDHNTDGALLQRYVSGVRSPHKTGATDSVRTECTVWYLESRVVACVLTKENQDTRWILDSDPQLLMGRMGKAITDAWPRKSVAAR